MNLLLQDITRYIILNPEEQECVLRLAETKNYDAKTFLYKEGETCSYIYFVTKGVLCGYYLDILNIEKVLLFVSPGKWTTDLKSFQNQIPSRYHIKALEDTKVIQLSQGNYEELFRIVPKLERYFRLIFCQILMDTSDRVKDSLTLAAEEHYDKFVKDRPDLANKVPQKYIASYIGVTPEFFSKMKSRLFKK
jgi:CRP-like cAMP-binding protein